MENRFKSSVAVMVAVCMLITEDKVEEMLVDKSIARKADLLLAREKFRNFARHFNRCNGFAGAQDFRNCISDIVDEMQHIVDELYSIYYTEYIKNVSFQQCHTLAKYTVVYFILKIADMYQKKINQGRKTIVNEIIEDLDGFSSHNDLSLLNDGFKCNVDLATDTMRRFHEKLMLEVSKVYFVENEAV